MIYFLSHPAASDYPRLNLKRGAPLCKVLADSLDELIGWGRQHGLRRIHLSRSGRPHFDLWGPYLELCPDAAELRRHRRLYRAHITNRR